MYTCILFLHICHVFLNQNQNGYKCQAVLCFSPHSRNHYMYIPKVWIICAAGIPNTYGAAPPDYFTEWEFQYDKLLTTHLLAVIFSDVDDDGLNNLS